MCSTPVVAVAGVDEVSPERLASMIDGDGCGKGGTATMKVDMLLLIVLKQDRLFYV